MPDPPVRPLDDRKSLNEDRHRHEECLKVLDELEACVDRRPDLESAWIKGLQSSFATFADALRLHFEGEERGAMYRDLPETKPRLAGRIDELRAEHDRLLSDLDVAVQRVADLSGKRIGEATKVRESIRDLIATLRLHEANETRLLQSAYWREVGTGD
jgi:hypothetical protein